MKLPFNLIARSNKQNQPGKNPSMWQALLGVIRQMGPFAILGISGAVVLARLFEELAEGVFRKESESLDHRFSLWVHSFASPLLDKVFKFFSALGGITGVIILTTLSFGVLARRNHPHAAWLIVLANGGGVLLNQALKFFFRRHRPQLWLSTDRRLRTFSFPSGHATVSLCFCASLGWAGVKFIKSPVVLAAWVSALVVYVFMVGLSRVYRGVHYLTDVVGGYISGGFWMSLLLSGISIYDRFHPKEVKKTEL